MSDSDFANALINIGNSLQKDELFFVYGPFGLSETGYEVEFTDNDGNRVFNDGKGNKEFDEKIKAKDNPAFGIKKLSDMCHFSAKAGLKLEKIFYQKRTNNFLLKFGKTA